MRRNSLSSKTNKYDMQIFLLSKHTAGTARLGSTHAARLPPMLCCGVLASARWQKDC